MATTATSLDVLLEHSEAPLVVNVSSAVWIAAVKRQARCELVDVRRSGAGSRAL